MDTGIAPLPVHDLAPVEPVPQHVIERAARQGLTPGGAPEAVDAALADDARAVELGFELPDGVQNRP